MVATSKFLFSKQFIFSLSSRHDLGCDTFLKYSFVSELFEFACINILDSDSEYYVDNVESAEFDSRVLYLLTLMLYNQIALTMLQEVHMHLIVMHKILLEDGAKPVKQP